MGHQGIYMSGMVGILCWHCTPCCAYLGVIKLFYISIFIYFFKYETIVKSSSWFFGHSDPDPSCVKKIKWGSFAMHKLLSEFLRLVHTFLFKGYVLNQHNILGFSNKNWGVLQNFFSLSYKNPWGILQDFYCHLLLCDRFHQNSFLKNKMAAEFRYDKPMDSLIVSESCKIFLTNNLSF